MISNISGLIDIVLEELFLFILEIGEQLGDI